MPITVEIADHGETQPAIDGVFAYFSEVEDRFSVFRKNSEISLINDGRLCQKQWSGDMENIFALAETAKKETNGYFNVKVPGGKFDTSGIVKGWAIKNAAEMLWNKGFKNFYIDAGGDIQVCGTNSQGKDWRVGIRNPFNTAGIVKTVYLKNEGIATSGTYIRGQHIYNPLKNNAPASDIVSVTVVGPDVCRADIFATAIFAMGKEGIEFAGKTKGIEAYVIDKDGIATMTSGFKKYTLGGHDENN